MKRSCLKYLILILSLILMLAPAMTVYADGPSADSGSDAGLTGEEYRADAEAPEHGSGEDLSDTDSDGSAGGQPQEAETFTVRWMLSEEDTEPLELLLVLLHFCLQTSFRPSRRTQFTMLYLPLSRHKRPARKMP